MTPVARWFRNARERLLGKFFDGPEPPERLSQMVIAFAETNPQATRFDWARFAIEHGRECYRSAYTRGLEYTERDPDEQALLAKLDPETLANAMDPTWHDWVWSPELRLDGIPRETVREFVFSEQEEMQRLIKQTERT
jgi:hypothetical protein